MKFSLSSLGPSLAIAGLALLAPVVLRAQTPIETAAAGLQAAIIAHAANHNSTNAAALETAFASYNSTVAAHADTTYTYNLSDQLAGVNPEPIIGYQMIRTPTSLYLATDIPTSNSAGFINFFRDPELGNTYGTVLNVAVDGSYSTSTATASLADRGAISNLSFSTIIAGSPPGYSHGAVAGILGTGKVTMVDSLFSSNEAARGGAMYSVTGGSPNALTLADVSFQYNYARDYGGAIYNAGGANATVTVASAEFLGNEGNLSGGAIYNLSGTVTLVDTSFTSNLATSTPSHGSYASPSELEPRHGGAIYNRDGTVVATNSSFTGNQANEGSGGAIYNTGGIVTLTDTNFSGNQAALAGAAIYQNTGTLNLRVTAGQTMGFTGNTVGGVALPYFPFTATGGAANSIHLEASGTLNVDVGAGGLLNQADPMTGNATGALAITKTGAGTWQLGGANVITSSGAGATTFNVTAGTLRLAAGASLSLAGAGSQLTVSNTGILAGSGTIDSLTTIGSTGRLAPDNSPGTLTFTNGLTLNNGSILDFQLGTASDLIRVSGGTLTGAASANGVTLNLSDSGGFAANTYVLFDFSGAATSSFDIADFKLGTTIAGYDYAFNLTSTSLELIATASAIPEPSTYATLAGLGALGLAVIRRRRTAA